MSSLALMGPRLSGHFKGSDTVFFNSFSTPFQLLKNKKTCCRKKPGGFYRGPLRRSGGRGSQRRSESISQRRRMTFRAQPYQGLRGRWKKVFRIRGRLNTSTVAQSTVNHCPERIYAECYAMKTRPGGRGIGRSSPRTLPTFAPLRNAFPPCPARSSLAPCASTSIG